VRLEQRAKDQQSVQVNCFRHKRVIKLKQQNTDLQVQ